MAFVITPSLLSAATKDLDVLFHTDIPEPYDREWITRVLIWVENTIEATGIEKTAVLNNDVVVTEDSSSSSSSSSSSTLSKKKKSIMLCAPADIRQDIITKTQQAIAELESPAARVEKKESLITIIKEKIGGGGGGGGGGESPSTSVALSSLDFDDQYVDGKIFIQPQMRSRLMWDELLREWLKHPSPNSNENNLNTPTEDTKIDKIFTYPHPNTTDYSLEDPATGMPYETLKSVKFFPGAPPEIIHISNFLRPIRHPLLIPYKQPHNLNMVLSSPFSLEKFHRFSIEYSKYNWRFRPLLHLMRSDSLDNHAVAEAIFVSGQCSDMSLQDIRSTNTPYICIHARRYMTQSQRYKLNTTPLHEDLPIFIKTAPDFLEIVSVEIAVRHKLLSERLLQKTCDTLYDSFIQNYKLHT